MDPRVENTLCERELHFPPYDANDLQNILEKRAGKAFEPGVLSGDVVPLCAAFAAQDKGSTRQALDLLLEAGDLAHRQSDLKVTEDHVRNAKQLLEKQHIEKLMKDLTSYGHLTLLAVVASTVSRPEDLPLQKQAVYDQYLDLV